MNNPSSNPAQGIDASRFQCNLDWFAAKNEGFSFAFVKATGGETYVDPCFKKNGFRGKSRSKFF